MPATFSPTTDWESENDVLRLNVLIQCTVHCISTFNRNTMQLRNSTTRRVFLLLMQATAQETLKRSSLLLLT